jgi:succinyl-CoA synthetase beta subunit
MAVKLFEFEAKAIATGFNVPLPKGVIISQAEEARSAFQSIGGPVVVKAQVLVSGRGKAGGIRFAENANEVEAAVCAILSSTIKGEDVRRLLIEQRVESKRELYLGVVVNRSAGCYTLLASTEGGVDIEEVSERSPEKIVRYDVDPLTGLREYEAREIARRLGYRGRQLAELTDLVVKVYRMAVACDGELVETNPLTETPSGGFIAADFRILVDDNSLYRHPELQERARLVGPELTPLEVRAREKGLAYVDLEGDIGVVGNGAGLVMATIDLIKYFGGSPANFCDLGGRRWLRPSVSGT